MATVLVFGSVARSQLTTNDAASLLFFPKIASDAERDTLVQVANRSNSAVFANCYYVDGSPETLLESWLLR